MKNVIGEVVSELMTGPGDRLVCDLCGRATCHERKFVCDGAMQRGPAAGVTMEEYHRQRPLWKEASRRVIEENCRRTGDDAVLVAGFFAFVGEVPVAVDPRGHTWREVCRGESSMDPNQRSWQECSECDAVRRVSMAETARGPLVAEDVLRPLMTRQKKSDGTRPCGESRGRA